MSVPIDPQRVEAQRRRVSEFRAEAAYHQRRVDSCNAQADVIERTWGLANCACWNEGQYGRVHREDCVLHKDMPEGPPAFESYRENPPSGKLLPPREDGA